ncbi:MAG: M23 family metallopeptidase [Proteobacteria bacterium]|nr:M23 family metallopeptidase [Pseudomonadota bacterium]
MSRIRDFGDDLWDFVQRMDERAQTCTDWQLQAIVQNLRAIMADIPRDNRSETAWIRRAMPALGAIADRDEEAAILLTQAEAILNLADQASAASILRPAPSPLVQRLFMLHQFLNGAAGQEDFGHLTSTPQADIQYGLGIRLLDGSMLTFLSRLAKAQGPDAERFFIRHFDAEGADLLRAVHEGEGALIDFFRQRLILRFDPTLSRKVYDMPGTWRAAFSRLGDIDVVRMTQLDLVAGTRFDNARWNARKTGITSLRGLALLFDADNLASSEIIHDAVSTTSESQKCLSLVDAVLSRMHGRMATHWQNRLETVFLGKGEFEGRLYDEKRFLGSEAQRRHWDDPALAFDTAITWHPTPKEGYEYVVKPGDRLSALTHQAYAGRADYRFVLRQNPHVVLQSGLEPGTTLYFPKLQPTSDDACVTAMTPLLRPEDDAIDLGDRRLTPVSPMTQAQRDGLLAALHRLPMNQWNTAMPISLPDGWAILCDHTPILLTSHENEAPCLALYPSGQNSLQAWILSLASQIRGDIELSPEVRLPFGSLPDQPQRRLWVKSALTRFMAEPDPGPLRAMIWAKTHAVDIVDHRNNTIVRLENVDFQAIRRQPHRRLSDYVASPLVQMEILTRLWLGDWLGPRCEIIVPPLLRSNQYTMQASEEETLLLVPMGTPVYPVACGEVVACGHYPRTGYGIMVRHKRGLYSRYTHLATIGVVPGQHLHADTMIGRAGASGEVSQPALGLSLSAPQQPISDWSQFGDHPMDYLDVVHTLWPKGSNIDVILR